ncbi:hypothetical protein KAR91_49575 [Candidatus Pacearchaeota archaeon]|nr:hypothetical protein [Candidatus Pacearchaeota archaeon]
MTRKKRKLSIKKRQDTKLGGKFTPVNKIPGIAAPSMLAKSIKQTEAPRSYQERQTDERSSIIFNTPDLIPAPKKGNWQEEQLKRFKKRYTPKQQAKIKEAMSPSKSTGKARGHNLKRGKADGDKGRKMASTERSKK